MPFAQRLLVTYENCIDINVLQSLCRQPVLGGHKAAELLLPGQLFSSPLP